MSTPSPSRGLPIEISELTKHFGSVLAVDHLDFVVEPGRVTGFLGPNGSGKTTTLRMLLGLVTPNAGRATIGGRFYRDLPDPSGTVGAVREATSFHPARRARTHLRMVARAGGHDEARADVVVYGHTHEPGCIGDYHFNSGCWARTNDTFVRIEEDGQTAVWEWLPSNRPALFPHALR